MLKYSLSLFFQTASLYECDIETARGRILEKETLFVCKNSILAHQTAKIFLDVFDFLRCRSGIIEIIQQLQNSVV